LRIILITAPPAHHARPILYRAFAALSLTLGLPAAGPAVAETLVVYSHATSS